MSSPPSLTEADRAAAAQAAAERVAETVRSRRGLTIYWHDDLR